MKSEIIPATMAHAEYISPRIREADRNEIWASHMAYPLEALRIGLKYSTYAFTGLADGEPVLIWGVAPASLLGRHGSPWMLASAKIDDPAITIRFLRESREQIVDFFQDYDILTNYVDARNKRSIRWLRFMGFQISEKPEPYGLAKMPFHKFEMKKCVLQS